MPRGKGTYGSKVGRPKKKKVAKKKGPAKSVRAAKPARVVRKGMGGISKAARSKRSISARKRRGG